MILKIALDMLFCILPAFSASITFLADMHQKDVILRNHDGVPTNTVSNSRYVSFFIHRLLIGYSILGAQVQILQNQHKIKFDRKF